jgi:hypothetical protein
MADDPNRIVFRDRQLMLRIFGVFWILMSLFLLFKKESMVIGLVLIAIGLLIGFVLPVSATIILDKTKGIVSARNWSLFSRSFKEYQLSDTSSIEVEYRTMHSSHKRQALSRLVVVTHSGEKLPLQTQFSSSTIANEFRASQMRKFLGVSGMQEAAVTPSQMARQFINRAVVPGQAAKSGVAVQQGVTLGVNWRVELATVGTQTVTHWISPDFTVLEEFLFLAQHGKDAKAIGGGDGLLGGLLGSVAQFAQNQMLNIYGFPPTATPGMERAGTVQPPPPQLDAYYALLSSNSVRAYELLKPYVVQALVLWAEGHPMGRGVQVAQKGKILQLAVLFSPNGLYLAFMNPPNEQQINEISVLGANLIRGMSA